MMLNIPPRYFYPGLVIGLLLLSVVFVVTTVVAAHSDGGPQVVEDYYQKSIDYDRTQALRRAATQTGWTLEVVNLEGAADGEALVFEFRGRDAGPVVGLEGSVELHRPDLAAAVGEAELVADEGVPGRYRAGVQPDQPGIWDVTVRAEKGGRTYLFELREEL